MLFPDNLCYSIKVSACFLKNNLYNFKSIYLSNMMYFDVDYEVH